MFKHNLTPTINTQRVDKNGNMPVRIRATIKRIVTYYPTGIMINPDCWDKVNKKVIKHPNKELLNTSIRIKISEIEKQFFEQNISGIESKRITPIKAITFNEYAIKKIKQAEGRESHYTIRNKYCGLNKFNTFKDNVKLNDCTASLLSKYESYLRGIGNADNTINAEIKFIKSIINSAVRESVLTKTPIIGFKATKYTNPLRQYLTIENIEKIEKWIKKTSDDKLLNVANWFLFSCYCGLRYSDVEKFTDKMIIDDKIILKTKKTGESVSIKMHPKLKEIYSRIKRTIPSNQKCNDYLKVIASFCEIDKPLSFHIARHTFAVLFLNNGGSLEVLSKLMAHSSIKTTQIYGRITNIRIDTEVEKVFG